MCNCVNTVCDAPPGASMWYAQCMRQTGAFRLQIHSTVARCAPRLVETMPPPFTGWKYERKCRRQVRASERPSTCARACVRLNEQSRLCGLLSERPDKAACNWANFSDTGRGIRDARANTSWRARPACPMQPSPRGCAASLWRVSLYNAIRRVFQRR